LTDVRSSTCAEPLRDEDIRSIEAWAARPRALADDPSRTWTRAYADELRGPPLSPAFYSLTPFHGFPQMFLALHGEPSQDLSECFRYVHASCYADIDLIRRMYEFQPRSLRSPGVLALFPAEFRGDVAAAPFRWRGRLRRLLTMEVVHRQRRSVAHVAERIDELLPAFEAGMRRLSASRLEPLDDDELQGHADELVATAGPFGIACGDAVMFHSADIRLALIAALDRWYGDGERRYAAVSTGLPGSLTVAEAQQLYELVAIARRRTSVLSAIESNTSWVALVDQLRGGGDGDFATALESFRGAHAHRGAHYKDVIHARWGDDPDLLLAVIRGGLAHGGESPKEMNDRAGQERIAEQESLIAGLSGPRNLLRRRALRWLFRWNDVYALVRDDHRFHFDRVWAEHRRILLERGRRLTARGVLQLPDEVFFLGRNELAWAMRSGDAPAPEVLDARRRVWEHSRRCAGPRYLRGDVGYDDVATPSFAAELSGVPASPGRAVGRARVVVDIAELEQVKPDDIVVTRQTDPSWSPVFPRISGLVLETGGVLAHGASLCREYALPCVTAVRQATERIPDGAHIEVDGASGVVRILSEPAPPNPISSRVERLGADGPTRSHPC
jgi:phosphohistidine swiveling domain-containing protein